MSIHEGGRVRLVDRPRVWGTVIKLYAETAVVRVDGYEGTNTFKLDKLEAQRVRVPVPNDPDVRRLANEINAVNGNRKGAVIELCKKVMEARSTATAMQVVARRMGTPEGDRLAADLDALVKIWRSK